MLLMNVVFQYRPIHRTVLIRTGWWCPVDENRCIVRSICVRSCGAAASGHWATVVTAYYAATTRCHEIGPVKTERRQRPGDWVTSWCNGNYRRVWRNGDRSTARARHSVNNSSHRHVGGI